MKNTFHVTVKGFSKTGDVSQEEHENCLANAIQEVLLDWIHCTKDTDVIVKPLRSV